MGKSIAPEMRLPCRDCPAHLRTKFTPKLKRQNRARQKGRQTSTAYATKMLIKKKEAEADFDM